jgi:hypothetical protein
LNGADSIEKVIESIDQIPLTIGREMILGGGIFQVCV